MNTCLYCASARLAAVVRTWFDRDALSQTMGLGSDELLLPAQTVGEARDAGAAR